jgi:hypothetical protein
LEATSEARTFSATPATSATSRPSGAPPATPGLSASAGPPPSSVANESVSRGVPPTPESAATGTPGGIDVSLATDVSEMFPAVSTAE